MFYALLRFKPRRVVNRKGPTKMVNLARSIYDLKGQ